MHYYQFNIGDYRSDTSHLSLLEHGIYRQLLDIYYLDEGPLPDKSKLMRLLCVRTADEERSLDNVLSDFFVWREGHGFSSKRCDLELSGIFSKSESARKAAKERWKKYKENQAINADAMQTHTERNADAMLHNTQEPNNTLPNTKEPKKKDSRAKALSCPQGVEQQVWDDYMAIRKAKRSPITETAMKTLIKEAEKAGITLNSAIQECVTRGWQGFKAEWFSGKKGKTLAEQEESDRRFREWLGDDDAIEGEIVK